jgi:hypothetical protein
LFCSFFAFAALNTLIITLFVAKVNVLPLYSRLRMTTIGCTARYMQEENTPATRAAGVLIFYVRWGQVCD